jgi:hypothetical protein
MVSLDLKCQFSRLFQNKIRNPIKLLHALNICLIILSGLRVESLYRFCLAGSDPTGRKNRALP